MSNSQNEHWTNKPLIAIVGLVASIIGIYTFLSGNENVNETLAGKTPTKYSNIISADITLSPTVVTQPTATRDISTSTPKATPVPETIEFENPSVSIKVYDDPTITSGKGKVQIQIISGNNPLTDVSLMLFPATIDIVGAWSAPFGGGGNVYKTNTNGIIEVEEDPGNFAVYNNDSSAVWNQMMGTWGIKVAYSNSHFLPIQSVILPVYSGKRTEIKISLAKIEIGVILDGEAYDDAFISVYCLDKDIAGNIKLVSCNAGHNYRRTDYTGTTGLNLGAGEYILEIRLYNGFSTYFYSPKIGVIPNENRQEIYYLDQMESYKYSIVEK